MLAIRLQRTGRKGHAQFRVIVQDSRLNPGSGRVVAYLGSYDPHTKATVIEKEKAGFYLEHGAQPSARIARLLQQEGVNLPKWVREETEQKRTTRNPGKLRKNRPAAAAEQSAPEPVAEAEEPSAAAADSDAAAQTPEAVAADDSVAGETGEDK